MFRDGCAYDEARNCGTPGKLCTVDSHGFNEDHIQEINCDGSAIFGNGGWEVGCSNSGPQGANSDVNLAQLNNCPLFLLNGVSNFSGASGKANSFGYFQRTAKCRNLRIVWPPETTANYHNGDSFTFTITGNTTIYGPFTFAIGPSGTSQASLAIAGAMGLPSNSVAVFDGATVNSSSEYWSYSATQKPNYDIGIMFPESGQALGPFSISIMSGIGGFSE